jgi:hypothetical protein
MKIQRAKLVLYMLVDAKTQSKETGVPFDPAAAIEDVKATIVGVTEQDVRDAMAELATIVSSMSDEQQLSIELIDKRTGKPFKFGRP